MNQRSSTVRYDDFGETFGRSRRNLHWEEIDDILSDFIGHSLSNAKIADIGCGNGRLLSHIQGHQDSKKYGDCVSMYVGLDASSVLIEQAQEDCLDHTVIPRIEWRVGDMLGLEKELSHFGIFDGIFFIASFHHLGTHEERISVISQAKNLLSKNGVIGMINWNLNHPSQHKYQSSKKYQYQNGSADYDIKIGKHHRFYHAFSEEEFILLARETGLTPSVYFGERNSIVFFHQ